MTWILVNRRSSSIAETDENGHFAIRIGEAVSDYLIRVTFSVGRDPFPAPASYEILTMDQAGADMGRVHLTVDVPPLRYEDHLGFVHVDGAWKLLTKVFRTAARLDEGE